MISVYGEHRGVQVEVEYDPPVAVFLRDRAQRIAAKAHGKNKRMAANFEAEVRAWDAVIDNPSLLNLVSEFEDIRKIYLDYVMYDHSDFLAGITMPAGEVGK